MSDSEQLLPWTVRFCRQWELVLAIFRYLSRVVRRDLATFGSFRVNNFFLFLGLLIWGAVESGQAPVSSYPFLLLAGFLLLFPLSSDPLARIPALRLSSWPLGKRERWMLRIASLALSPVMWVLFLLLLAAAPAISAGFLALVAAVQGGMALARRPLAGFRLPDWLGGLIQNSTRQISSVLDAYVALLLSVGGTAYQVVAPHPDPAAFPILAMLVALALSTWAQSLFGLDSASGVTRYRLMPLSGVRILWTKDVAYLGILFVLTLPLDLRAGMTFGLAALAVGHVPSVLLRVPQMRWRFTAGRFAFGVVQVLVATMLAYSGLLAVAGAGWLISLYCCGRWWDRQPLH